MASLPQAPLALIPSRHLVYHAPPSLTISLLTDVVGSPPPEFSSSVSQSWLC